MQRLGPQGEGCKVCSQPLHPGALSPLNLIATLTPKVETIAILSMFMGLGPLFYQPTVGAYRYKYHLKVYVRYRLP